MRNGKLFSLFLGGLLFFIFTVVTMRAYAQNDADFDKNIKIFFELIKHYKKYPEKLTRIRKQGDLKPVDEEKYERISIRYLRTLSKKVLDPRFSNFNLEYVSYKKLLEKSAKQLGETRKKLDDLPLSDPNRRFRELTFENQKKKVEQIKDYLFYSSLNANKSILSSLEAFNVADKVEKQAEADAILAEKPSDMPGVQGYSRQERLRQQESGKINLMPVDEDFYVTDLGQKLEEDLGGRADFWSYDYDRDELYVKVGDKMGKLLVRQDQPGVRFVQTRVGNTFSEPIGSAMKVDLFRSKGRFLTGDKNEETLFGAFPDTREKLAEEPGAFPPPRAPSTHPGN